MQAARHFLVKNAPIAMRKCSSKAAYTKTYEVSPRCTINGYVSFNTNLQPHDSHNTTECDKLILTCDKHINVNQIGTALNLTTERDLFDPKTTCHLQVPLKSNINLTCLGDCKVGDLHGDGVRVFSEMGGISLGNLKCDEIQAGTNDKDITTEGDLQATRIDFLCRKTGAIKAKRIKCLGMKMDTNEGDIAVDACYSKNAYFVTKTGNMFLKNVHNRCRIEVLKQGTVRVIGLEGALELCMQNGTADLQLQKLFDSSDILVREAGDVTIRIPEEMLDYVEILVWSSGCYVDEEIPHVEDELKDLTTIRKKDRKIEHTLRVKCSKATCNVRLASWTDVVEKQIKEKQQFTQM